MDIIGIDTSGLRSAYDALLDDITYFEQVMPDELWRDFAATTDDLDERILHLEARLDTTFSAEQRDAIRTTFVHGIDAAYRIYSELEEARDGGVDDGDIPARIARAERLGELGRRMSAAIDDAESEALALATSYTDG